MKKQAAGARLAPAKSAARPAAAVSCGGAPSHDPRVWPAVAPMKKSGVTSPPRNPEPSVTTVKIHFAAQAQGGQAASEKQDSMEGSPGSMG